MQHFLQIYDADRFQRYDYGEEINLLRYKQAKPEPYPLENIRSPYISLIYSANDHLVSLDDIKQVKNSLKGKCLINDTHQVSFIDLIKTFTCNFFPIPGHQQFHSSTIISSPTNTGITLTLSLASNRAATSTLAFSDYWHAPGSALTLPTMKYNPFNL